LVDLPLGAVQGAEDVRLAEPQPLGDAASAELVALDEAVHRALARIELAQVVVDTSRVGCCDRGNFNAIGRRVADDVFEELADRQLLRTSAPTTRSSAWPRCSAPGPKRRSRSAF
jgi:hypothetical protein